MRFLSLIFSLSRQSLWNRRLTVGLTVFAIAVSVMLVLGVEKVRHDAKSSFANTISGTDLIVGARSGAVQLLLYSVFRIGNATNNISWNVYEELAARKEVKWAIPISLGDSHKGFRVMGTTADYFRHYQYAQSRPLAFQSGAPFADIFDAVLGADVAKTLGYKLGDPIIVAHGIGKAGFKKHDDKPFKVTGILKKTGTPVDRTVHVSLKAIEAIHVDWQSGSRLPGMSISKDQVRQMDLKPAAITAILLRLNSRLSIFGMQRQINTYADEPLLAVLPGVALQELWGLMGTAEAALGAISLLVVASGLLGMVTMLLSSLNERRREMAVLRAIGARPAHILALFCAESLLITALGAVFGLAFLYGGLIIVQPILDTQFGLFLPIHPPSAGDCVLLALIVLAGFLAGLIPAFRAYRYSLADGMVIRT